MIYASAAPGVYGIFCLRNRKMYIGSSGNVIKRINEHRSQLRRGRHIQLPRMQNDWNRFGEGAFAFCQFICPPQQRKEDYEIYLIEAFETLEHQRGYNVMVGGECGIEASIRSTETKLKRSGKFYFLPGIHPHTPMLTIYINTFNRWSKG
jgi:group I intron endonuclease